MKLSVRHAKHAQQIVSLPMTEKFRVPIFQVRGASNAVPENSLKQETVFVTLVPQGKRSCKRERVLALSVLLVKLVPARSRRVIIVCQVFTNPPREGRTVCHAFQASTKTKKENPRVGLAFQANIGNQQIKATDVGIAKRVNIPLPQVLCAPVVI